LDKEVSLIWDYSSDLPVLKTDRKKLRHILENIINNAIKFTAKGCVTVSAQHFPEQEKVAFRVMDTGIGIPKESMPFIFEMFRQVGDSQLRSSGVGLGLHIVKKFTEMLAGDVQVESQLGRGSTFTVTIPCS
jgi:signal transduction histidine kinase